jgi:peptidoglycan/LPS O-acetylase OafA/YrhL
MPHLAPGELNSRLQFQPQIHPTYRPDVDGLRAVAILSVVLFHAFPEALPGGFVGVDIFFVISGFLISSIIFLNLRNGNFSLLDFFARRIKRIFPALGVVLLVSFAVGWVIMHDDELVHLGRYIACGAGFVANLIYWRESGYFDVASERKPLLHLWSLGIEEQFYLVWPLLLILAWRWHWRISILIGLLLVSSFIASILAVNKQAATAFYLPHMRFWELLAGAALAWVCKDSASKDGRAMLSFTGFVLLAASFFGLNSESKFPGLGALPAVLGTSLIIAAGSGNVLNQQFLGRATMIKLGLISYPLYLWHWPVLSFSRLILGRVLEVQERVLLLGVSIVLAWLTWRYIELPVRRAGLGLRRLAAFLFAGLLGIALLANADLRIEKSPGEPVPPIGMSKADDIQTSIMLLGDSHAGHLVSGLSNHLPGQILNASVNGCLPFMGVDRYDSRSRPGLCQKAMNDAIAQFRTSLNLRSIVLSAMGPIYLTGEPFKYGDRARVRGQVMSLEGQPSLKDHWAIYEAGMRHTLGELVATGKNIVFALDVPELGIEPQDCLEMQRQIQVFGHAVVVRKGHLPCSVSRVEYDARTARYRALVIRVLRDYPSVQLFDPIPWLCDHAVCHGIKENQFFYSDADHLSLQGSAFIAARILPLLATRPPADPSTR